MGLKVFTRLKIDPRAHSSDNALQRQSSLETVPILGTTPLKTTRLKVTCALEAIGSNHPFFMKRRYTAEVVEEAASRSSLHPYRAEEVRR